MIFRPALLMIILIVPATAFAAGTPKKVVPTKKVEPAKAIETTKEVEPIKEVEPTETKQINADQGKVTWSAGTGMGYDSNAFQAPRKAYVDYATAGNPTVVPQEKSGFFVPYKASVEAEKQIEQQDGRLIGSATVDGNFYLGGLGNANEFNLEANGGALLNLGGKTSKRTLYAGLVFEKHDKVYVDHDSGASKTTAGGSNISNRYNYIGSGIEGEFKDNVADIDYSVKTRYQTNTFDDPVVVAAMDHTFFTVDGEADYHVKKGIKLKFSAAHSTRNYSKRHARRADGVYSSITNPLLKYTYNDLGVTLRNRISSVWAVYLDYDYSQRIDGYVNYNDYKSHRYGGRIAFEEELLNGRVSLHHWKRDYPHAFAFDVAGQAGKVYSGTDLKFKAEFVETKNLSFWAEAIITMQNSTDLRYEYDRKQLIAGVKWEQ